MNPILTTLQTPEFGVECLLQLPPAAARSMLSRSAAVRRLREAYQTGEVTPEDIRDFVDEAIKELKPGYCLPAEDELATIAVALEPFQDDFAEEYISDLAKVRISEMGYSRRVAGECHKARHPEHE